MLKTHALQLSIGNSLVCNDLNIGIKPGEIWAVIGRNGTGKTTLLHTLAGLIKPNSGRITLQNKPLTTTPPIALAQQVGLLLQDNDFSFPIRVSAVVSAGRHPYRKEKNSDDAHIIRKALEITELTALKNRFVNTLSGGEKRRCALATVLTQTPNIYLLDEPMNHLDLIHQQAINQHCVRLAKENNASIIMTTHDMNIVKTLCDHTLALLGNGEYVFGETDDVLEPILRMGFSSHPHLNPLPQAGEG